MSSSSKAGFLDFMRQTYATADPRLQPKGRSESWGDRLKGQMLLTSPDEVDAGVEALLRQAWERS